MSFGIGRNIAEVHFLKNSETGPISWNFLNFEYFDKIMHKHCFWREVDRGIAKCHLCYAEVQILKTNESDPLSFWNILICICPNSEKSKTEKDLTHLHM